MKDQIQKFTDRNLEPGGNQDIANLAENNMGSGLNLPGGESYKEQPSMRTRGNVQIPNWESINLADATSQINQPTENVHGSATVQSTENNVTTGSQNANLNYYQYGDDSSPENQAQRGGMNPKYTGEGVSNTYIEYDPNLRTGDLNPNYLYGENARQQNRQEAGYIARRNDQIASALYNEGLTSRADIENYLSQQGGWMDSTLEDRLNTIDAIWKRIGEIQPQEEENYQPTDVSNAMKEDLTQEQGKLYGKITPDTGDPSLGINQLDEGYAINQQMIQSRINKVVALQNMGPKNIAASVHAGRTPYGEQAMRDYKKYDPQGYAEYEKELKNLYTQDKVDILSHGSAEDESKSFIDSTEESIKNDNKDWTMQNTDSNNKTAGSLLEQKLLSNETASNAKEEMLNIKKDLANLNSELEDLPRLARESFAGDVPDYIYQAFISNNQQRLQRKISNLENRYASLSDIYKTEVAQAQWELEYDLKKQEMNRNLVNDAFDRDYKTKKLLQDSIQIVDGVPYIIDPTTGNMVQVDDVTAYNYYMDKVNEMITWGNSMIGVDTGLECEGFTDKITRSTAGVEMEWSSDPRGTTAEEKVAYATGGGYIDDNGNIVYGDNDVYDIIPQVGDVAVMVDNGKNKVDPYWGHTMYVDKVWTDANGNIVFHYIASNKDGDRKGYEGTKTLQEFQNAGGVGFWNPYKQAQWNGRSQTGDNSYSPMQPTIDKLMEQYRKEGKTNMFSELGKFQEIYTNLYNADKNGELSSLLDQGAIGTFLQNMALSWAQSQGGDGNIDDRSALDRFFSLTVEQILAEADNYYAQHAGDEKAFAGFQEMMRAVEIKLRDESGAAINRSERATNFLLYLPKATDTQYTKERKLARLEEYIRRLGTDAGINSSSYIPLNLGQKNREYD